METNSVAMCSVTKTRNFCTDACESAMWNVVVNLIKWTCEPMATRSAENRLNQKHEWVIYNCIIETLALLFFKSDKFKVE